MAITHVWTSHLATTRIVILTVAGLGSGKIEGKKRDSEKELSFMRPFDILDFWEHFLCCRSNGLGIDFCLFSPISELQNNCKFIINRFMYMYNVRTTSFEMLSAWLFIRCTCIPSKMHTHSKRLVYYLKIMIDWLFPPITFRIQFLFKSETFSFELIH